jgi:hypothetical protein
MALLIAIVYLLIARSARILTARSLHLRIDHNPVIGKKVDKVLKVQVTQGRRMPSAKSSVHLAKMEQQIMVRLRHMPPGLPPICLN